LIRFEYISNIYSITSIIGIISLIFIVKKEFSYLVCILLIVIMFR
jgi:hypothetical protein